MSTWIRADADFGAPVATLVLSARSELGREYRQILCDNPTPGESFNPLLADKVTAFLERCRPDLRGMLLFGVHINGMGMSWEFFVAHASLKRKPMMESPPRQLLETCWTCGRSISAETGPKVVHYLRQVPLTLAEEEMSDPGEAVVDSGFLTERPMKSVLVCSEGCVTADRWLRPEQWTATTEEEIKNSGVLDALRKSSPAANEEMRNLGGSFATIIAVDEAVGVTDLWQPPKEEPSPKTWSLACWTCGSAVPRESNWIRQISPKESVNGAAARVRVCSSECIKAERRPRTRVVAVTPEEGWTGMPRVHEVVEFEFQSVGRRLSDPILSDCTCRACQNSAEVPHEEGCPWHR